MARKQSNLGQRRQFTPKKKEVSKKVPEKAQRKWDEFDVYTNKHVEVDESLNRV